MEKGIGSHPGGISLTKRLLALSGIRPPALALDLGAGDGKTVDYLESLGVCAVGVDLDGKDPGEKRDAGGWKTRTSGIGIAGIAGRVIRQDMTALGFADGLFDVCLAECSISVCGDGMAALREACRVLKPGGSFLISDVFFGKEDAPAMSMGAPLTRDCWKDAFERSGFKVLDICDETALWREFFLESLWNGNANEGCLAFFREAGKAKCGYFAAWLKKAE